ncbi:Na+/H+ antiporter NhaA [Microbacterium sp. BK668]|uniref:Na+/H+ antiporter NhaA n=1 Tax=Microbacterium sp. BK668 TaxID=2512118 RepID=UPI00105F3054|nr:Na+/H+ antiporter NhaA [Microbacterium sp. BK668]TDN92387.1 sodium/proton antiporter (NhaA family) [Microbacterium sp. BK668]
MKLLRSARFPAILLLVAAAAGLLLANSPLGHDLIEFSHAHLAIPGTAIDLSLTHWVSDGLLVFFFFAVSVELQYELTRGELRSARRALQPALAAAGGVVVPIAVYLVMTAGSGLQEGWPIPTATDIAFALGVLAVFGRGLPSSVRIFLLALAILDDIVGIIFIAVLFASGLDLGMLAAGLITTVLFGALSRVVFTRARGLVIAALIVLAVATWVFILLSGVHATIAGVLLGLAMAQQPALVTRHAMEPWINGVILPIFAFTAALVPIPAAASGLSPVFWAILVALPVGKLLGIAGAGWLGQRLFANSPDHPKLAFGDLIAAGALGGIGFTVSLLLANLAFAVQPAIRDQAILGVLAGSLASAVAASFLVAWRARHHRRAGTAVIEATS